MARSKIVIELDMTGLMTDDELMTVTDRLLDNGMIQDWIVGAIVDTRRRFGLSGPRPVSRNARAYYPPGHPPIPTTARRRRRG